MAADKLALFWQQWGRTSNCLLQDQITLLSLALFLTLVTTCKGFLGRCNSCATDSRYVVHLGTNVGHRFGAARALRLWRLSLSPYDSLLFSLTPFNIRWNLLATMSGTDLSIDHRHTGVALFNFRVWMAIHRARDLPAVLISLAAGLGLHWSGHQSKHTPRSMHRNGV